MAHRTRVRRSVLERGAAASIEPDVLRLILRRFAAGVTVITSVDEGGDPAGLTATAFASVSLAPPLALVCIDAASRTRVAIESHDAFAVNVLAARQKDVAKRFASKGTDKFAGVGWQAGGTGSPLLDGALGWVECRVAHAVEAGTHVIYIGAVLDGAVGEGDPLLYYEGGYRSLGPEPGAH